MTLKIQNKPSIRGAQPDCKKSSRTTEHVGPQPSMWRELRNLAIKIALIALVFVLLFTFLYGVSRNTDPDMDPFVRDGDLVIFYRLDRDYAIGDLIVLQFQGEIQVRRVVAKAGDIVDFTENRLVINGETQLETDIYQPTRRYDNNVTFPLVVGEGQVFVLGDARDNATDSRVYGAVDVQQTQGTVITVIRRRNL